MDSVRNCKSVTDEKGQERGEFSSRRKELRNLQKTGWKTAKRVLKLNKRYEWIDGTKAGRID